ncbi:MAG: CTP synthase [Chlamydiota bacterium]
MTHYIFITGGVVSSLGKGLLAASIGMLLESRGFKIAMLKFDPYLNVDPGTMNPFEHGEVYVTDDGGETDLDLGHYYRFTQSPLSRASNVTSGQIYHSVIRKERRGDYLGKTVQVIPHVTEEVKQRIIQCANQKPGIDIVIIEIGGTIGDIESQPFLEAIRQFRLEHPKDCANLHLTYVPYLKAAGEIKTKPTQHSTQTLRGIGIIPDFILYRSEKALEQAEKKKISLFCSVPETAVIEILDVKNTIYELPLNLIQEELDEKLCSQLNLKGAERNITLWKKTLQAITHAKHELCIALVGKYTKHKDAYKSVCEALFHAAAHCQVKLEIKEIDAEHLTDIKPCDGYLVPGGFGERGFNGKLAIAAHCRIHKIPYFGICLGMQVMVIEFARSVLGLKEAHSTEVDPFTHHPIISLLAEQKNISDLGGSMRLGAYHCLLEPNTRAAAAYAQTNRISERHRHRYEFNNAYRAQCEQNGLIFSGKYPENDLAEIIELADHPWMLGAQFHPEFQSKPTSPHPLFTAFIRAALTHKTSCSKLKPATVN